VQQIDSSSANVQGVQLRMVETGEVVTSAADGSFRFADSSPRSFTLALLKTPPVAAFSLTGQAGSANDTGSNDNGSNDNGSNDNGSNDNGSNDNGSNDNGSNDTGSSDNGSSDNGSNDNGSNDNGSNDNGSNDNGSDHVSDDGDGNDTEGSGDGVDDASRDDGDDSTETEVAVHRVENGERVHVRVRIRDGQLDRVEVSRSTHDEREVELHLRRAATSDDADIKGKLETESRNDRQRMQVSVERATSGRDVEMFVIAPDGTEESLGIVTVDVRGKASLEINTLVGGVLPAGATTVADLEGYDVEVRDATDGTALLWATIPSAAAAVPTDPTSGGSGSGGDDGASGRTRGESRLTAQVAGLQGNVEVRSRPAASRERFKMEGEHLGAYVSVEFFVEDSLGAGTFTSVGVRTVKVEGDAELKLDTGHGDSLPNAASSASDLVGLAVEVRDAATGDVLLTGTIPALTADR